MKIFKAIKHTLLFALIVGVAVGCATTPKEEPVEPEPQQQQEPQGPTAAEAQAAIERARAAINEAQAAGALWRDTADILAQAEKALAAGDTARAVELADRARRQAENALRQKQLEDERLAQQQRQAGSYTVQRGDNLWGIAGKSDVYGNPYQWPLIYKANRDKINDADLIYPGQNFTIRRDWSTSEVDAAVQHARTRGAWSLGVVEESDRAYLAR